MMGLLRGLPPLRYFIKTPGQKRHEEKIFERGRKKGRQEALSEFQKLKDYEIHEVREATEAEKQRMREGYEKRLGTKEEELQRRGTTTDARQNKRIGNNIKSAITTISRRNR